MSGQRLSDAQRLDWLQLIRCGNIGPRTFRMLLNKFGGAGAALAALPGLISKGEGAAVIKLATRAEVEREVEASAALGIIFVALGEPDYPPALAEIDTSPPVIAVRGPLAILQRRCIALVGSRNASAAGLAFTARLAREFGRDGFAVVSGLARGIDAGAHQAALVTGTIAVLAGGHARIYPSDHEPLCDEIIAAGGVVISEMPLNWEPRGRDFPRRNRIVSGLSQAVVVVEAARRSGSLITAKFALEQGREVFAVPGSPLDPRAEGTNDLLRQGAGLCTRAQDVTDALGAAQRSSRPDPGLFGEGGTDTQEPLWDEADPFGTSVLDIPAFETGFELDEPERAAPGNPDVVRTTPGRLAGMGGPVQGAASVEALLGPSPVSLDDLVRACGRPAREVMREVFELELAGKILRQGNGLISLISA